MTLPALCRLIRCLLAALGAPARLIARVWSRDARAMRGLAHLLDNFGRRGWRLRFDGEDESVAAARLAHLDWIRRDPNRAARHIARGLRGYARSRLAAMYAPMSWRPRAVLAGDVVLLHLPPSLAIIDSS